MATKWGVVGAGKISHDFVNAVQSIQEAERQHEFVAVAARNLSASRAFAENNKIAKAYGCYEELAKDSDIEVVYIGIVSAFHFEVGKLMLENGKHVLMEKPMTLNSRQTKFLIDLARENNCFLMEALWSRFTPAYKFMRDAIGKDLIGDIVHVNANLGVKLPPDVDVLKCGVGGGTLLDIGIYPVNITTMLFGGEKPKMVKAVGCLTDEGVDISVSGSLSYGNNGTASIAASAIADYACDIQIVGTKGYIKVPSHCFCPTTVIINDETYHFFLPDTIRPANYPNSSGLRYEAMEVRRCLKKGDLESSLMPLKDSETMAQIMEEMHHQIGVKFAED